jgi:formylglycine-generating enzyme required for sulfatase activity
MKKWLGFLMCGFLCVLLLGGLSVDCSLAQEKTFANSIGMEFVLIPAGKVSYAWEGKDEFGEDIRQRTVTISKPFYLGKFEVTQEQWVAVMGEGSNPSKFKGRTNPVEQVSWDDVQVFIQKLNQKEGGNKYRLPTEAEWEHAARAGTTTEYFLGDDPAALSQYAWFSENSQGTIHPVGEKKPNPWGLYDIYGNVWEWVADWYGDYRAGTVADPTGPDSGSTRVVRGGSWSGTAETCRSAGRNRGVPGFRGGSLGFRLAFSPGQ